MLESVMAVRFDRRMSKGRTRPCLISCERSDGNEVEAICKFPANGQTRSTGLVSEAVAAMLAADLGLPVPEPLIVYFDSGFADVVAQRDTEIASIMRQGARTAFGSSKLPPGYSIIPPGLNLGENLDIAADIFAFDALTQNPDRMIANPNCLFDGKSLAIIDHELCFEIDGIIGWKPPWESGSLGFMRNKHAFFAGLHKKPNNLSRLRRAWLNITAERRNEYFQALPPEWLVDMERVKKIFYYLDELHGKIDEALSEVARVLV